MSLADELFEATRAGIWPEMEQAARSMSRFDFIAEYLRRHTARKADRELVSG